MEYNQSHEPDQTTLETVFIKTAKRLVTDPGSTPESFPLAIAGHEGIAPSEFTRPIEITDSLRQLVNSEVIKSARLRYSSPSRLEESDASEFSYLTLSIELPNTGASKVTELKDFTVKKHFDAELGHEFYELEATTELAKDGARYLLDEDATMPPTLRQGLAMIDSFELTCRSLTPEEQELFFTALNDYASR